MDYAVYTLTIHPDISGRPQTLLMLERIIAHINAHEGVQWATFDQIAADFHIYLERGVIVPGAGWGVSLGATTRQRHSGLEITRVMPGGCAERAGLQPKDLLVSLRGHRVYATAPLWTMLALTDAGTEAEVSFIRGRELMGGRATF